MLPRSCANQRFFFAVADFFIFFVALKRAFLGNMALLQALNWLIKPVWIFFIEVAVQNRLGNDLYGQYYSIFGLALLFNILLDFGLNNYTASAIAGSPNHAVPRSILRLRLYLAAAYVLLTGILGWLQGMNLNLLALVLLNQVLAGFTLYHRAILQGRHLFKTDSIASVTDRLVAVLFLVWLVGSSRFQGEQGLYYFLLAQTLGYTVSMVFSAYYARKNAATPADVSISNGPLIGKMGWFAALSLAMAVFTRVDTQMLKHLAPGGDAAVGMYARSFRFLDAALIFSTLISAQLLPMFTRMLAKQENTDGLVWLNMRIILFVALPVAFTGVFYAEPLLRLFYQKSHGAGFTPEDVSTFRLLMLCFVPMALVHIFGTWLTAAGVLKKLGMLAVSCVGVNILLNLIFIPKLGAAGAAMAGCVTQSVFVVCCAYWVFCFGGYVLNFRRIMALCLWLMLVFVTFYWTVSNIAGLTGFFLACGIWAFIGVSMFIPEWRNWIYRGD